jgi:hypothetical protein
MTAPMAELRPHPRTACAAIRRIGAAVDTGAWPRLLHVRFCIEGDIGRLELPGAGFARRRDGLWQHTCLETFIRADDEASYYEFNFSPSGDWAAYRFGSRRGERSLPELPAPAVHWHVGRERCDLSAELPVAAVPELARAAAVRAGLSAVIETRDGALSYWALAHAGEHPDFHDPATFTLRITMPQVTPP